MYTVYGSIASAILAFTMPTRTNMDSSLNPYPSCVMPHQECPTVTCWAPPTGLPQICLHALPIGCAFLKAVSRVQKHLRSDQLRRGLPLYVRYVCPYGTSSTRRGLYVEIPAYELGALVHAQHTEVLTVIEPVGSDKTPPAGTGGTCG